MAQSRSASKSRWLETGICASLAILVWFVFGQTLQHEFVNFDDDAYVYENPAVRQGLTAQSVPWAFTHVVASNWHPLTILSHMLDCQLYQLKPGGHHLTNVLLHTATVILLFLFLRRATDRLWPTAFVAAVFAIHPLRAESVAWVAERKDVLSGLFFVLTLLTYLRYASKPSVARYVPVVILFALGLMSKPMLVTLPVVLLLLDYWPLGRCKSADQKRFAIPRRVLLEKIPLILLSAAMCVATILSQHSALHAADNISLSMRSGNAIVSVAIYALQLFYPANLAVFVPYPDGGWSMGVIVLASVVLVGISAAAFYWRDKQPWLLVGWLWFIIMLLPVIGLIQVGAQARADRYTYLPEIGLSIAMTWAICGFTAAWNNRSTVLGISGVVVIAALAVTARAQTAFWHDNESLWTHALACTARNAIAESNLAIYLLHQGRFDDAINHSQAALAIQPNYPEAENCLGYALFESGRLEDAVPHYQTALKIRPDFAPAHINLGMALLQSKRPEEAAVEFKGALKSQPDSADAHSNLGVALLRTGHPADAVTEYRAALQLDPNMVGANNNLAWLLATHPDASVRDGRRAIPLAEHASQLSPGNLVILRTLAAAYAEAGRFPEAIDTSGQTLQLATTQNRAAWIKVLNSDLNLYRAGQPLHDAGQ